MLIEKLEKPVNLNTGERATHSVTSSLNGIVTVLYVDAETAKMFKRAIEFGKRRAFAVIRETVKKITDPS